MMPVFTICVVMLTLFPGLYGLQLMGSMSLGTFMMHMYMIPAMSCSGITVYGMHIIPSLQSILLSQTVSPAAKQACLFVYALGLFIISGCAFQCFFDAVKGMLSAAWTHVSRMRAFT